MMQSPPELAIEPRSASKPEALYLDRDRWQRSKATHDTQRRKDETEALKRN